MGDGLGSVIGGLVAVSATAGAAVSVLGFPSLSRFAGRGTGDVVVVGTVVSDAIVSDIFAEDERREEGEG